ncbi:hypothetical protein LXA43DRAFT_1060038 [Ganoderma leucocontextum]|nr:hypothetical protein LXA43DRAFT_1060038 [Ganoderma leucocontextum]
MCGPGQRRRLASNRYVSTKLESERIWENGDALVQGALNLRLAGEICLSAGAGSGIVTAQEKYIREYLTWLSVKSCERVCNGRRAAPGDTSTGREHTVGTGHWTFCEGKFPPGPLLVRLFRYWRTISPPLLVVMDKLGQAQSAYAPAGVLSHSARMSGMRTELQGRYLTESTTCLHDRCEHWGGQETSVMRLSGLGRDFVWS